MLNVERFVEGLHDYIGRALNPIIERIAALESRAPEKGEKGDKGDKGEPGLDAQPLSIDDVTPLIEQAVKEFPKPQDGVDGKDGKDGRDGIDGKSVTLDDVRPFLEAELSKWALDFERRAQDTLQRAIDRMPAPKDGKDGVNGKDGRDAFQLEDIQLSLADDDRTLTLAFAREGVRVERSIRLNHPIYRGIWKDGAYEKGDCVTFGGSAFIATRETKSKPETDDSWKLCVKRGRDGKDGQRGEKGDRGERGPKGEPPYDPGTGKIR